MPQFIRVNSKTAINADQIVRVDDMEMGPMQGAGPRFLIISYANGEKDEFHGADIDAILQALSTIEIKAGPRA